MFNGNIARYRSGFVLSDDHALANRLHSATTTYIKHVKLCQNLRSVGSVVERLAWVESVHCSLREQSVRLDDQKGRKL